MSSRTIAWLIVFCFLILSAQAATCVSVAWVSNAQNQRLDVIESRLSIEKPKTTKAAPKETEPVEPFHFYKVIAIAPTNHIARTWMFRSRTPPRVVWGEREGHLMCDGYYTIELIHGWRIVTTDEGEDK